ncbi:MAG TPA: glycogen debranching protein GlgX [Acidimicrobiales bacterium]|nr:glycogen debranching protein GlgX [Acidimicrobiales bacterium]
MRVWPGQPYPLGATFDGTGTNFAVFSEVAEGVELCLFDEDGTEWKVELPEVDGHTWHGYLPNVGPGQRYGYRVQGPWAPEYGHRCNAAKLLLDPYAKAVHGDVDWHESVFGYELGDSTGTELEASDSGPFAPKAVVVNPFFDWANDRPPRTPWHETLLYELHVKGFTQLHPDVPEELRGTYAGLATPPVIEHLKSLNVSAVELMPVHHFIHDHRLVEMGLRNYWGYNSISYLAPHGGYSSAGTLGQQVQEFKNLVRTMHEAGIEVILDVVYNHTAEGNHLGPTLGFKGLDNAAYYRLMAEDPRFYMDYTGTGNSLNMRHPNVLQLIMDSLRYWVTEMHVDGFRFDLAATLARELHDVDRLSAFFDLIQQDPVIRQVKLIAEPWDVGEGGYQVGNFPPLWSEWNGKYRDAVRDYWRGEPRTRAEMAYRLTGSSDLYADNGRSPSASINFVTAHDGFTMHDLVSYNEKHNEANGENNQDGESHNRSWNCGVEGPTDDLEVMALRERQKRNLLATLLLSQGVPMLVAGDEMGRTQGGNNNAYCQDNEISWVDWSGVDENFVLLQFVRSVAALRRKHPTFRRRRFFQGRPVMGSEVTDIGWFTPEGERMPDDEWDEGAARSMAVFLNGDAIATPDARGEKVADDSFFLLLNADPAPGAFTIPVGPWGEQWEVVVDTGFAWISAEGSASGDPEERSLKAGTEVPLEGRSLMLLRRLW